MIETMSAADYQAKIASSSKTKRNDYEHREQVALFYWSSLMLRKYPELELLFAIPNGGQRHKVAAMKLKAEGVKSGVPDVMLPVAKKKYHGLFIEMKFGKNKTSENQNIWIENLKQQKYKVEVCYSAEEAQNVIEKYLN